MALICRVGRKSFRNRAIIAVIYLLLTGGSLAMLYPFCLMLAGSTKGAVDSPEFQPVPGFWLKERALYNRYLESFFNETLDTMKAAYGQQFTAFDKADPPAHPNARLTAAWRDFLTAAKLPDCAYMIEATQASASKAVLPYRLRQFREQLVKRFDGDIDAMNRQLGSDYLNWSSFYIVPDDFLLRRNKLSGRPFDREFRKFKGSVPLDGRYYFSPEGFYRTLFLQTQYTQELDAYNQAHGTKYASWDEVHLDRRLPTGPGRTDKEREDWESFVRSILNLLWLRADADAAPFYRQYLQAKYRDLATLNQRYGTTYRAFEAVPLIGEPPEEGVALSDWEAFLEGWKDPDAGETHKLPATLIRIHSVDFLFRDYLERKYGFLAAANTALGTHAAGWLDFSPPQQDLNYFSFKERRKALRKEFSVRNFITVFDYIGLHGRGLQNTVIYCVLAILSALIVNPLAAYALSRFRPPSTYKVLLFLMLTMAFPPMVTQIPNFLMLRELNLLNTFWALILPGLANGYSIFLLKGFFDSLPQELYEAADLDGAGELRIFWQITMSLSTPILAVIALGAFNYAYSNFMMALLICQDERMWTLMPWLYQLRMRSGDGVIFASLLIAAVPTLVVFSFCQNVIMRGIVVPVEK